MRTILSFSVYSLIVYISCIMQHVNNIFWLFPKKITKICARATTDPVSGFRVGIAFIWQKLISWFCAKIRVTGRQQQYVPIVRTPRTPLESAVLTTSRGNAMIIWRDCNWYNFLVFIKWLLGHNHFEFSYACLFTDIYIKKIHWVIDDPVLVLRVSILFWFSEG
jgi:hypothetical protein